jgi:hypothetical protein
MDNESAFSALHLRPNSFEPPRKPKVILVKKAGPITCGLTQPEIAGGDPVPQPPGSNQPNRKSIRITTHNVESVIRGPIVDDHQLDSIVVPVPVFVPYTIERGRDEPLAVVSRHND